MSVLKLAKEKSRYFRKTPEKKLIQSCEFICDLCKNEYHDPRVLPCLHCFCASCLQKLDSNQNFRMQKGPHKEGLQGILVGYFSKNNSAKNDYLRLDVNGEGKDTLQSDPCRSSKLKCPTCGSENVIPPNGVFELPPHYLLQHRMLINSLNRNGICLLCDLCPSEIPATSRCTKCLLNLCSHCSKAHGRENLFPDHELTKLQKNNEYGVGITRIRRQAMCHAHPEKELKLYCSSCNQVTCKECRSEFHSGHECESSSRAAQMYTCRIRENLDRTQALFKDTSSTMSRLNALYKQIEAKYSQVQKDINCHIDCYVDALEEHRKVLLKQAVQIRNAQIRSVQAKQREVEKKAKDIKYILDFGEELVTEGSDFEVLSFAFYVLQRLEWCIKTGSAAFNSAFTSCIGTLHFLPKERAGSIKNYPVYGVVTTQVVSPSNCYITSEGINALRSCRDKERCELSLVTVDNNNQRLNYGGEGIEVELKPKSGTKRPIPIFIIDRQNGLYDICFTPESPGKMSLSVSIRGIPIKDSPFSICVARKNHKEVFHCCTFGSTGGNKNSVCGCDGRMPGEYQSCGHGFTGHPGQLHWSCCGNTLHKSECFRNLRDNGFYQLSL